MKSQLVVQKYLENSLTLDGRKVGIRDYVSVISMDPFVVIYHKGYIKSCALKFDLDRLDSEKPDYMGHLDNFYKWDKKSVYPTIDRKFWYPEFEKRLTEEYGLNQDDFKMFNNNAKAIVLYSILAVKEKLAKKFGTYFLLVK